MQSSRFCVCTSSLLYRGLGQDKMIIFINATLFPYWGIALEDCNHSIISNYPNTFYDSLEINLRREVVNMNRKWSNVFGDHNSTFLITIQDPIFH